MNDAYLPEQLMYGDAARILKMFAVEFHHWRVGWRLVETEEQRHIHISKTPVLNKAFCLKYFNMSEEFNGGYSFHKEEINKRLERVVEVLKLQED